MGEELLNRWDYGLNQYSPKELGAKSKEYIYFKCPEGKKHSSHRVRLSNATEKMNVICPQCSSFEEWCLQNERNDLLVRWDYELNMCNPIDVFKKTDKKYWFACTKNERHVGTLMSISGITTKNSSVLCKECNSIGQYIIDNYGAKFLESHWSDLNELSYYKYGCYDQTPLYWVCSVHGEYTQKASVAIHNNFTCPQCCKQTDSSQNIIFYNKSSKSSLQTKVEKYLQKYDYKLYHEKCCSLIPINPKTGYALPYDNELVLVDNSRLIIEVHGTQHYYANHFFFHEKGLTMEEKLKHRKIKDRYKKMYALSKGYYYLELPYWTIRDNSYENLIDDKISNILSGDVKWNPSPSV